MSNDLPSSPPNFEHTLQSLETIVERLERGDLDLEQALQDFERGVELVRSCRQALDQAEQRVQILIEKEGTITMMNMESSVESGLNPGIKRHVN